MRRYTRNALAILLLSLVAAPVAASNCPPNAFHCQLLVGLGDDAYVLAEFGVEAQTELMTAAAIFPVPSGASVHVWAKVYVASNSTGQSANVTVSLQETEGVTFPGSANRTALATTTPENLTFPLALDPDILAGDVLFLPAIVLHEDGSRASTHIPLQVGSIAGPTGTQTWIDGLMDWWWALALALLLGAAIGLALGRTGSR